jgi:uncharacterized protein YecA (UPF0149 family)
MQDIRELLRREADGQIETLRSTLVGYETPALMREFAARRKAAEERLEKGETESLRITEARRIGRNDPCPCNSGIKFKKCCGVNFQDDDPRLAD